MDSESTPRSAEPVTSPPVASPEGTTPPSSAASPSSGLRTGPLLGLLAACVAGAVAWGVVETVYPFFEIGEGYEIPSLGAPPEMFERSRAAHAAVAQKNAALNLALIGGLIALGLAGVEGCLRRNWLMVAVAPILGLVFGGVAGFVGGQIHGGLIADGSMTELPNVIKVHAILLLPLGLGVGLAMGLVTSNVQTAIKAAVVGAIAGGVAAVAYTLIVSLVFSTIGTEDLIPSVAMGRLVWTLTGAAMLGLIIPGAVKK